MQRYISVSVCLSLSLSVSLRFCGHGFLSLLRLQRCSSVCNRKAMEIASALKRKGATAPLPEPEEEMGAIGGSDPTKGI